jgi:osmotically-inducible protein OsmY
MRPSTRTDPEIARDVQHVLKLHAMLGDMKIIATVEEGFVPLEGMVEWNCQKTSAVDAAESVRGVRGVINLIIVKPAVTATSVKNDIEAALRRSAELDARKIQVSVHGSTVE